MQTTVTRDYAFTVYNHGPQTVVVNAATRAAAQQALIAAGYTKIRTAR